MLQHDTPCLFHLWYNTFENIKQLWKKKWKQKDKENS